MLHKGKKILLIQRKREPLKDYWCLPGGYINYEESLGEAICRETKEETDQDLTIQGLVGVYRVDNDPRGISTDIIYFGKGKGKINLGTEDKKWKYFSANNLPKQIAYKHREAINDWFCRENS